MRYAVEKADFVGQMPEEGVSPEAEVSSELRSSSVSVVASWLAWVCLVRSHSEWKIP